MIETRIEDIDVQLKTVEGKLKAFGKIELSFYCENCHIQCRPVLEYNEEHPSPDYKCKCGAEYEITSEIRFNPHIGGKEEVELTKRAQPIINRIKASIKS